MPAKTKKEPPPLINKAISFKYATVGITIIYDLRKLCHQLDE
jgi:hypothetical protein